jgi:hypothetical protein
MFCPKCGKTMTWKDGARYCSEGDMHLSELMEQTLAMAIAETPFQKIQFVETKIPNGWRCPRCNFQLVFVKGKLGELICSNCSLSIDAKTAFRLLEIHPHKRLEGGWM